VGWLLASNVLSGSFVVLLAPQNINVLSDERHPVSYKSYDLAWPDPDEEPRPEPTPATAELMTMGLSRDEAEQWQDLALPSEPRLVTAALQGDRETLSPVVFANWCLLGGWTVSSARAHHWAGFTREEAEFMRSLVRHHKLAAPLDTNASVIEDWLTAPLTAAWICRALANGVTQVEHAVELWRRSLFDPELTVRLDRRADSRGANNRDLRLNYFLFAQRPGPHRKRNQGETGTPSALDALIADITGEAVQ
jgi:hypothetical protein